MATSPVLVAMLAACIALSARLWGADREYPPVPLLDVPQPPGALAVAALIALLAVALVPRRWTPAPFLAAAAVLAIGDLTRLQPWLYQGALCLGAFALCRQPLDACRLVLAATYVWSGLTKLNPDFAPGVLAWLVPPATQLGPAALWSFGIGVALLEAGTGMALLVPRARRVGVVAAVATHAIVLAAVGPAGHDWNRVVWPWNLATCALVILLFWGEGEPARSILWSRNGYHQALVALVGVLPALNLAGVWDSYLSFSLYSSNIDEAWLVIAPGGVATAPGSARAVAERRPDGTLVAWFVQWAVRDVGVPPYPERRAYLAVFRALCRSAPDPRALHLIVIQRWPITHARPGPEVHACEPR
jgi:hypothetical protein